jgi:4-hydroxy-3-methylbut-2-enyl diphosphate reductase
MKKFNIPEFYKSEIIGEIKESRRKQDRLKKDFSPTEIKAAGLTIYLARHFGFCYGVENAVEIAYRAIEENPGKRIFLLSEMIHNPEVNSDLLSQGVTFLMDTMGNELYDWTKLTAEDIVIVPAFGTTVEMQQKLNKLGINPYAFDTTCPFVEKVWNRAAQIGERGYTVVVHGKPNHEETRATFSHAKETTPTVVVKNLKEAENLARYIRREKPANHFFEEFKGKYSEGFDPEKDLKKIGVVNQTTMLASETQEIADYLRDVILLHHQVDIGNAQEYFANTRDTLCYATNDNQSATRALLNQKADLAVVVGGYNSSNTSHLVELSEDVLPTYFIQSDEDLISSYEIQHYDLKKKEIIRSKNIFPEKEEITILLTSGASCPDMVMERVLKKLTSFFDNTPDWKHVIKLVEERLKI